MTDGETWSIRVAVPKASFFMTSGPCILLVDDDADDRALMQHELGKALPEALFREIGTLEELEEAIKGVDLVITDYQLKTGNGLQVLRRAKEASQDLPVIMFTGTGSEEIAVEAMKSGLEDYVLKSPRHRGRLLSAVQLALRTRKQQQDLAEAETRFKNLFDTVPVGLFRCTPAGAILDANPALVAMLGFPDRGELMKASFPALHEKAEEFSQWRDTLERHGSVGFIEARFRGHDGAVKWVQIHAKAIRDAVTREVFYEGSVEDIKAHKEAQEEREALIIQLQEALARVKTLTGLLPICASCKRIREENGNWNQIEIYIQNHSEAQFTHGFCPDCAIRLYPEVFVDTGD